LLSLAVGRGSSSRSEHCRQTGDAWSVSSSVAAVDVVAVHDRAGELLRHKVHLVGRLRAAEHAERLRSLLTRRLKTGGGSGQRLFPGRGAKAPAVSDQRLGQTAKATIHEPNTIGKRTQRYALRAVGGHELLDPAQPERQLVLRLRVSEADEPFPRRAKRGPRQNRDAGFVQQAARQLVLVEPRAFDVREDVERSLRPRAANTGYVVHAVDHQVAAVLEHLDHAAHRVL